jgi:two-component system alkaline phosphatase synthesis response regulator PhoP
MALIYIVEDDESIGMLIRAALGAAAHETRLMRDAQELEHALEEETPGLLLLDIMRPEEDGLQILKKLRADPRTQRIPVIMLTAKGSEYDKVIGLEAGADDYIPKPFGMMELIARVKALLRRASDAPAPETYQVGCLTVCPQRHSVEVDGAAITLTLKEYELLCMLLKNRNMVLTRDRLLNQIWGYSFDGENRTVDVHIRTLRQKLGPAGDPIETVRGVGYRIGGDGR